jgi:ParB family transcriptional regulator, chromosome partitioning protein
MSRDINMPLAIDDILIPEGRREVDPAVVKRLADSIESIGLRHPVTVRKKGEQYILVAGRHRKVGREHVPAIIVSMTNSEARMWEIAENLHRAELSKLERAEQIEEWRKLAAEQSGKLSHSHPAEHGVSKTADALGIDRAAVRNAEKIANITPEAKAAAHEAGMADNQSKLLEVARQPAGQQVAKVIQLAQRPLSDGESTEKQVATLMAAWNRAGPEARAEFMATIDKPIMDERFA